MIFRLPTSKLNEDRSTLLLAGMNQTSVLSNQNDWSTGELHKFFLLQDGFLVT